MEEIINSYINGQRKQMVEQIKECGVCLFCAELPFCKLIKDSDKYNILSYLVMSQTDFKGDFKC